MGLTIHYSFKFKGTEQQARKKMQELHRAAGDLPFKEVAQLQELEGDRCDYNNVKRDDPNSWMLIQAFESVDLPKKSSDGCAYSVTVMPTKMIAFSARPGKGCEEANFGLCQFPSTIETSQGKVKTKLAGWSWGSFCKTQYAGNPDFGGTQNFLRCHLTVIALLDKAKELGILARVSDEGGFWKNRDVKALAGSEESWNKMMAAFVGGFNDMVEGVSNDGAKGVSAISAYPNVERLEAEGQAQMPASLKKLFAMTTKDKFYVSPLGAPKWKP
jgi:hypothetical protein